MNFKKSNFYILFLFIVIASCKGQSNSNLPKEEKTYIQPTTPPFIKDSNSAAAQIAEYVVEIFEDKKGNLWFGTMDKGVARYDASPNASGGRGKSLTYFSKKDGLPGNTVLGVSEDQEGNLWFGTHSGASKYDGKTFTNFGQAAGLGVGCKILITRNGDIWARTNDGAFRYDGTTFSKFEIPNPVIENPSYKWVTGKVWSFLEDSKGNIWFGRDGLGVCKYDARPNDSGGWGKTFTHFTKKDGLCSNNVSEILEDKNGNIWFGSISSDFPEYINEGGVSFYDGNNLTKFPEIKGLTENDIYTLFKDKMGNIWIGAIGHGAYHYDGENFTLFDDTNRKDLTKKFAIQSICEDKNGTLWFGFSGGLFRFDGKTFLNVTQDDLRR